MLLEHIILEQIPIFQLLNLIVKLHCLQVLPIATQTH